MINKQGNKINKPATSFQSIINQDANAMNDTPIENAICSKIYDRSLNLPIKSYFKNV